MICVCLEHVFAQRIREIGIRILRMAAVGRERFTRVAGSRERVRGIQDKRFNGKLNDRINERAERIMRIYGNSIIRLTYSYLHNMSDAEEILQDTLVRFLKNAPEFENEDHEKAWLLRVAANLSKNRIEYNKIRYTDELRDTLAAEQREDLSFVWEAVRELPVRYREVIHLFYYEGYSTAQIGTILKMKEATVRSSLSRGRGKLREILKEVYDFEETV